MDYFVWTPELNIGVDEIDEEHMRWIAYINALHIGIEEGKEPAHIKQLLNDIIEFAKEHFAHEEALFINTDYPHKEQHKKLHKEYLEDLKDLLNRLDLKQANFLISDITLSLRDWLITHVQDVDRQYAPYLKTKT